MLFVLITGCSTGIGLATAVRFARSGHRVFAGVRTSGTATQLDEAVSSGLPITPVRIDVDDDRFVEQGVAEVLSKVPYIDVLVNNAGIGGGGPVELAPLARAKQTFETNYFGAVRMIQAVLPRMRERRSGAIVNITSIAGRVALAGHSHYAASKFALEALSEILAQEVRPFGIRVAIVEPGVVRTPMFEKRSAKGESAHPYEMPVRRLNRFFEKQLENPTLPEAVAAEIEHAVTADSPRLRYLVGEDAKTLFRGRCRMGDEEWIAAHALEADGRFFEAMSQCMGADLYR